MSTMNTLTTAKNEMAEAGRGNLEEMEPKVQEVGCSSLYTICLLDGQLMSNYKIVFFN